LINADITGGSGILVSTIATSTISVINTQPQIISDYNASFTSTALTTTYVAQAVMVLTSTLPSTPITAWGSMTAKDNGGSGAIIQSIISIGGSNVGAAAATEELSNGHYGTIACFWKGYGSSTVSTGTGYYETAVQVLGRVSTGSATKTVAQIMAIANTNNA
jgi:hypothetical protein